MQKWPYALSLYRRRFNNKKSENTIFPFAFFSLGLPATRNSLQVFPSVSVTSIKAVPPRHCMAGGGGGVEVMVLHKKYKSPHSRKKKIEPLISEVKVWKRKWWKRRGKYRFHSSRNGNPTPMQSPVATPGFMPEPWS